MCSSIKILFALLIFVAVLMVVSSDAFAYEGTLRVCPECTKQMITLKDGSVLVGKVTAVGNKSVLFQTAMGEMNIAIDQIESVKEELPTPAAPEVQQPKPAEPEQPKPTEPEKPKTVEAEQPRPAESPAKVGKGWFPNPNRTRLLVGPNARTLEAGKGYLFDLWIFFPGIAYGITDNITVAGGASIIPGVDDQMFYFAPKVGFAPSENLSLAGNLMIFRLWEETLYFALGNMTYGTDDASVTFGTGIAWNDNGVMDKPAFTFGGDYRLAPRMGLVGEGWFVPGDEDNGFLLLGGVRLMGEMMTLDIGFAASWESRNDNAQSGESENDDTSWLPYLDFVWEF